jgi:hypothetical protein
MQIEYFSPTLAGDWWPLKRGHIVTLDPETATKIAFLRGEEWVVSGWNKSGVLLARDAELIHRKPEDIEMRIASKSEAA